MDRSSGLWTVPNAERQLEGKAGDGKQLMSCAPVGAGASRDPGAALACRQTLLHIFSPLEETASNTPMKKFVLNSETASTFACGI